MPTSPRTYARLPHAYGPATDTPEQLRLLLTGTPDEVEEAAGHLHSALLHQGTLFPAAAPALQDLLEAPNTELSEPSTLAVLNFVAGAAEGVKEAGRSLTALDQMIPPNVDELLAQLAAGEEEEESDAWGIHGDAAYAWALVRCAEQLPGAVVALTSLQRHLRREISVAAREALEQIEEAQAVLRG